ncbi:MAG TPA: hypothetical protein VND93_30580 [Myxococcales bacterium]|nr:hypothetical protein [Myxococcales bacterium]
MDSGDEKVGDSAEQQALRQQARKVYLETVISAVLLTAAVVAIP